MSFMKGNKEDKNNKTVAKEDPAFAGLDVMGNNTLKLPKEVQKELEEAGYSWRFVNEAEFRRNYNLHHSGWLPYNVTNKRASKTIEGIDPEGVFRRGDLILAVRPVEFTNKHKKLVQEKTARQNQHNKVVADELRQSLRSNNISGKIFEGYEDN